MPVWDIWVHPTGRRGSAAARTAMGGRIRVNAWLFLHNKIFASLTGAASCLSFPAARAVPWKQSRALPPPPAPLAGGFSPRPCQPPISTRKQLFSQPQPSFLGEGHIFSFVGGLWQNYTGRRANLSSPFMISQPFARLGHLPQFAPICTNLHRFVPICTNYLHQFASGVAAAQRRLEKANWVVLSVLVCFLALSHGFLV